MKKPNYPVYVISKGRYDSCLTANFLLKDKVDIGTSQSWVIPIIFGDERKSLPLGDYLMRLGYDFSIMMFPAVKKNQSIIRAFVTSEHTKEQLDGCAESLIQASKEFNFNI